MKLDIRGGGGASCFLSPSPSESPLPCGRPSAWLASAYGLCRGLNMALFRAVFARKVFSQAAFLHFLVAFPGGGGGCHRKATRRHWAVSSEVRAGSAHPTPWEHPRPLRVPQTHDTFIFLFGFRSLFTFPAELGRVAMPSPLFLLTAACPSVPGPAGACGGRAGALIVPALICSPARRLSHCPAILLGNLGP